MVSNYTNEIAVRYYSNYMNDINQDFIDKQSEEMFNFNDMLSNVGKKIKPITRRSMVYVFQNCQCCERHQRKRPNIIQYDLKFSGEYDSDNEEDTYTDASDDSDEDINNCRCHCRHLNRMLCRVQNVVCNVVIDSSKNENN
jgi:hypothetical protein